MAKRVIIPEARIALNQMKIEIASELGLNNYQNIDKGNLSSRENGDLVGNIIKKIKDKY